MQRCPQKEHTHISTKTKLPKYYNSEFQSIYDFYYITNMNLNVEILHDRSTYSSV